MTSTLHDATIECESLNILHAMQDGLSPRLQAAAEQAARHIRERRSTSSRRSYARAWDDWRAHCATRYIDSSPIDPAELITYLTARSRAGMAPASVRLHLYALSIIDVEMRTTALQPHPAAVRAHPLVSAWLRGWGRENPKRPKRIAPAITPQQLESMLQAAQERPRGMSVPQHIALYTRDRAMILLGIAGALRISEVVALTLEDVRAHERGLTVLVRRGKADQEGKGHERGITPQGRAIRCPVDAWHAWLKIRGTQPGPAFCATPKGNQELRLEPMHESAARRVITRRARAVGLELVSSHSMRATFATLAAERRKPITRIADHGGWSSLDVLRGYVRQGELFVDSPSSGLLDD